MSEQTMATETTTETIATQPETVVTPTTTEVDYEAELKRVNSELEKTQTEKENYRKAYLKKGGKIPEDSMDTETPETPEEMVRRVTREELSRTKESQLLAQRDAIYEKTVKRNKELEVALRNRGQITSTSAGGSNEDRPEVKTDSYFSQDQIKALKAKGWSDEKIATAKKNMIKGSEMPKV